MEISEEQLAKIFELAGHDINPENAISDDISRALIKIEEKLLSFNGDSDGLIESSMKVLVVDDLELSTYKLSLLLNKINIVPVVVHTKQDAISEIKKQKFDFLFIDLFLPDSDDGLEVMRYANNFRNENNRQYKLVAISGTDDLNLVTDCFNAGVDEFVSKSAKWHEQILRIIVDKNVYHTRKNFVRYDINETTVVYNVKSLTKQEYADEVYHNASSVILAGVENIILNMENVQNMHQESANIFTELYKKCNNAGGKLVLLKPSDAVKDVLAYSCLLDVIKIAETSEQAFETINT